jgi:hypothetical protein
MTEERPRIYTATLRKRHEGAQKARPLRKIHGQKSPKHDDSMLIPLEPHKVIREPVFSSFVTNKFIPYSVPHFQNHFPTAGQWK